MPSAWNPSEIGDYTFTVAVSDGVSTTTISWVVTVTRAFAKCDVDMNGACQAFDAVLILQHTAGTLVTALTDTQLLAADMNEDAMVGAFDAALVLQAVVGLKQGEIGSPAGTLAFGSIEQTEGVYGIPVMLTDAANVRSLEFSLAFDPAQVSVQAVKAGSSTTDWLIAQRIDAVNGVVTIAMAGIEDASNGDLFTLIVSAANTDALGTISGEARLNAAASSALGAVDVIEIPDSYTLSQNYPNPFNPTTSIQYQLPEATGVKIAVFDMQGRLVRTIVNQEQKAGTYTVQWDGRSESGVQAASGMYIYQIRTESFVSTKRMMLVK
jgi:VCBS repeat-containing protein